MLLHRENLSPQKEVLQLVHTEKMSGAGDRRKRDFQSGLNN